MKTYPNLTKPLKIGSVTVKNRMMMAPMDTGFGNKPWGGFTPEGVEYFVRRAEGGFGLLFSGGTAPDNRVDQTESILDHRDEFIRVGREMNRRIESYGGKMFMQLSAGVGRNGGLKSPSELPSLGNPAIMTKALTVEEIREKVRMMGEGAALCREAGFAGVDIHALHWGHLLDSFALSLMNRRTDAYGGSLENRLRIVREIREAIAERCGWDYPVTIRFAVRSFMKDFNKASFDGREEAGRTLEEAAEIAKLLESYGYDALGTDAGTLDAFYYAMPPSYVERGYTLPYLRELRKAVKIPILAGARMADPDLSEGAIAEGVIDAAVIGRAAIADPDYAKKIVESRPEDIRTCIGCNQGCIWGYFTFGRVGCAVNPTVGHEKDGEIGKADRKKKVLVVGGGIAGMEAARIAVLRGHDVTLCEKSDRLGGNLIPAGSHDFKSEVAELNAYFIHQTKSLPIDVRLGTEVTPDMVKEMKPDAVILALGSTPVMPRSIEGIDHPKTVSGVDACLGKKPVGQRVVIVGSGLVGCEIAFGYCREGKDVTIVEALGEILSLNNVPGMNKAMLLDAFEHYGTRILTGTKLKGVRDEGAVVILPDGKEETIPADTLVLSIGYRPVKSMKEDLLMLNCGAEVIEIGDGRQVGNVLTCIRDAYEAMKDL